MTVQYKRKRRASSPPGLAAGVELKRDFLPGSNQSWGWVLTEVTSPEHITNEHRKLTCGLSKRNKATTCRNSLDSQKSRPSTKVEGDQSDIIVISDDDEFECSKKNCKSNPFCLNYLGQTKWENEEEAKKHFMKQLKLGEDPSGGKRDPNVPVGLTNLGATCYANSSLQVWFRDAAFRQGVYQCTISETDGSKLEDSPLFQLQVIFGALQEGACGVFNPVKLVESLRIPQDTQQDAQEFSKLFMTLLDSQFQRQSIPSIRSLLRDRFQGKQVYGTRCIACNNASERENDFLEIELHFKNNVKLEDCIAESLEPETLSGENQYFCSWCQRKQDATRYTQYRTLPPALHFSLHRFVYDFNTMSRKKSKDSILFPRTLEMGQFLPQGSAVYDLRAILLHKGPSAYHGHYEAQVFDDDKRSWFLFNDELVTPIKTIGDKRPSKASDKAKSNVDKQRVNAKKKRRIEDSEEEEIVQYQDTIPGTGTSLTEYVSSKEAYMLVYSLREEPMLQDCRGPPVDIPAAAMKIVKEADEQHRLAVDKHRRKIQEAEAAFLAIRKKVLEIVQEWVVDQTKPSVVVSRQSLQRWLGEACMSAALKELKASSSSNLESDKMDIDPPIVSIPIDSVLCQEHTLLNPDDAHDMKCISKTAYDKIKEQTSCVILPELSTEDVCRFCVEAKFKERVYQQEHPRLIDEFEKIGLAALDEEGFWISKPWLRDWQLKRPKMHVLGQDDPSPDDAYYRDDVYCPHNMLSPVTINRRRITMQGYDILKKLFPQWTSPGTEAEICSVCAVEQHVSKEQRQENRKKAEHEKNRFQFMLDKDADSLEDVPLALIPYSFLVKWRRWANGRGDVLRPEPFDNRQFICQHNQLSIDPNTSSDMTGTAIVVRLEDFNALTTEFYEGSGPLIPLKRLVLDGGVMHYIHDTDVCEPCRQTRKTDWTINEISIRTASLPTNGATKGEGSGSNGNKRQSRRLRKNKECKILVDKDETVENIKVKIQEELRIPTIRQTLFMRGRELTNGDECVGQQLFLNEVLEMREEKEVISLSDDDDQALVIGRDEGAAFGGTLLSGCGF